MFNMLASGSDPTCRVGRVKIAIQKPSEQVKETLEPRDRVYIPYVVYFLPTCCGVLFRPAALAA